MWRTRITLVLAILLSAAAGAAADTTLTVEQAVATALTRNLSLQRARIDLEALRRSSDDAWNSLIPSIKASAGIVRTNEQGDKVSVLGAAELSLTFSPSLSTQIRTARLDYEAGVLVEKKARRELELQVRKAFYELLLVQENLRLAEQNITRAQARYDQTAAKQKAGLAPDLDLLSARVSLEKLKPQAESYGTSLANGLEAFKVLLGLEVDAGVSLSGSLEAGVVEPAAAAAAANKEGPDAVRLKVSLESARNSKKTAELESFAPALSLAVSTEPTLTNPWSPGEWRDQGSVSLGVSLALDNFLPRSAARDKIARSDDTVRKLESQLKESRIETRTTIQSLTRTIDTAARTLEAQRLNVDLAQKTYDLTDDAYRKGVKDLLVLQSAAGDLESARVDVLSSSYQLIRALLDLEYALDLPFGSLWR